jgi:hypothetical protein
MYYASLGTLVITNPSVGTPVVEETTPPIDWTFSGRTQQAYRLTLYDQSQVDEDGLTSGWGDDWGRRWGGSGMQEIWTSGWQQSAATVAHIPPHLIKRLNNAYYGIKVEVNDTIDRTSCPGTPAIVELFRVFTFQEVTAISTVSSIAVSNPEGWYLQLDWVDTVEPDYYGVKVDGEYIHDRETPSKYHTSGTNYRKKFYGMRPLRNSTFEVVRIVQDGGAGAPYRHSKNNPTQTTRFIPLGIWIADEETDTAVNIGRGGDDASMDLAVREGNTVYYPLGRRDAVRVVDSIGGFEGTVSGLIRSLDDKERFELFKAQLPSKQFRLIAGDLSIRFRMGEVTRLVPTGDPIRSNAVADKLWAVTVEVFQSDDWTFRARY